MTGRTLKPADLRIDVEVGQDLILFQIRRQRRGTAAPSSTLRQSADQHGRDPAAHQRRRTACRNVRSGTGARHPSRTLISVVNRLCPQCCPTRRRRMSGRAARRCPGCPCMASMIPHSRQYRSWTASALAAGRPPLITSTKCIHSSPSPRLSMRRSLPPARRLASTASEITKSATFQVSFPASAPRGCCCPAAWPPVRRSASHSAMPRYRLP